MVIWDNLFTNKLNKLQFFMSYFFGGTKNVVLKQLLDLLALTAANGDLFAISFLRLFHEIFAIFCVKTLDLPKLI